jgi:hypothetical protein
MSEVKLLSSPAENVLLGTGCSVGFSIAGGALIVSPSGLVVFE